MDYYEQKEREARFLIKMGFLVIILLLILLLACLRIRNIRIIGSTHYSEEQLAGMVFSEPWDTNSCWQFIKEKTGEHKVIPFVEKYDLRFEDPFSVEVIVYEKNIVGYVDYMSSHMYFDKDGIVVESSNEQLPDIPMIRGLKFGSISLYRELPVEDKRVFNDILNLTGSLSSFGIGCENIEYDYLLNATLSVDNLKVLLGQDTDMEMKVALLHDILPKLEGRKGTLDLSVFSRNAERESYIFKEESAAE